MKPHFWSQLWLLTYLALLDTVKRWHSRSAIIRLFYLFSLKVLHSLYPIHAINIFFKNISFSVRWYFIEKSYTIIEWEHTRRVEHEIIVMAGNNFCPNIHYHLDVGYQLLLKKWSIEDLLIKVHVSFEGFETI